MSLSEQHVINQYIEQYRLDQHLNADLIRSLRLFQFDEGQEVYTAEQEISYIYFMVHGKAKVNYYLANGKDSIVAMVFPFSVIGDIELFDDKPLQLNVTTTERSLFLGIRKADALQYGYNDPQFLRFLIHHLSRKLRGSGYTQLSHHLPLINRLANYLLSQARDENIIVPDSKSLIADLLATSIRHLNRVIKTLEEEDVIQWKQRQVIVQDLQKLQLYGEL